MNNQASEACVTIMYEEILETVLGGTDPVMGDLVIG